MLKTSSLDALRAFVECGSVSLAAVRLGRTQPQVGRLLAALEEELGFPLFSRAGRRLSLTPEGRRFYQQAERVLAGHDDLSRLAAQIRTDAGDSHLRVLTAPQVASVLLGEALAEMARRRPDFSASIDSRVRLDAEAVVAQEHFDLGVTVPPLLHPSLQVEPLCEVEAVIAMRRNHPLAAHVRITLADLPGQDMIGTHPRSTLRQHLEPLCREAGFQPRFRFEATNGVVACQMAAAGLGIALSDPFVARSASAPGLVIRRFVPAIPLPYGLFYPIWQPRSETVAQFAALVSKTARRLAGTLMRGRHVSPRRGG